MGCVTSSRINSTKQLIWKPSCVDEPTHLSYPHTLTGMITSHISIHKYVYNCIVHHHTHTDTHHIVKCCTLKYDTYMALHHIVTAHTGKIATTHALDQLDPHNQSANSCGQSVGNPIRARGGKLVKTIYTIHTGTHHIVNCCTCTYGTHHTLNIHDTSPHCQLLTLARLQPITHTWLPGSPQSVTQALWSNQIINWWIHICTTSQSYNYHAHIVCNPIRVGILVKTIKQHCESTNT